MPKYVVRYGSMRHLGVFSCRARDRYARGQRVIARTGRGQESGEVLCEATEHVVSQMGKDPQTGQILRLESSDDGVELRRIHSQEDKEFATCEKQIAELGLEMKLIRVERLYGGERVVIYYLSEDRVDFRELVKILAKELQTRVEMRQIGVRDEAKLLADYGDCGKPVCCNTHLSDMPPVSMKMAKLQKATLDPTKISGRCGRLKCCLRYEYDTYQELQRELPRVGYDILTRDGKARVLSQEILTSELLVQTEDMRRVVIPASEVLSVVGKAARPKPAASQDEPSGDVGKADSGKDKKRRGRHRDSPRKPSDPTIEKTDGPTTSKPDPAGEVVNEASPTAPPAEPPTEPPPNNPPPPKGEEG